MNEQLELLLGAKRVEKFVFRIASAYLRKLAKDHGKMLSVKIINEGYRATGAFSYNQLLKIFGSIVRMRRIAKAQKPKQDK